MSKHRIRQQMRALRAALNPEAVAMASDTLLSILLAHPIYKSSTHIALYRAIDHEISVNNLLSDPRCQDKIFYAPRINAQQQLDFSPVDVATNYQRNRFGIDEPQAVLSTIPPHQLEMVLIPTLALNPAGYRLGFGGGYYDKTFEQRSNRPFLLAIVYDFQTNIDFTPEPHDIRCHDKITISIPTN